MRIIQRETLLARAAKEANIPWSQETGRAFTEALYSLGWQLLPALTASSHYTPKEADPLFDKLRELAVSFDHITEIMEKDNDPLRFKAAAFLDWCWPELFNERPVAATSAPLTISRRYWASWERKHLKGLDPAHHANDQMLCDADGEVWPCPAFEAAVALAEKRAAHERAIKAEQSARRIEASRKRPSAA